MLKKTVTYTDFNGEEVTEDCYFHLSKAELIELEMSHKGGLSEALQEIIRSEDGKAIIAEFKNIILGAYGKRSPDGKRFIKTQSDRDEFESSEAYSTIFVEIVTDPEAAAQFISGIIPHDMAEEAARITAAAEAPILASVDTPESEVVEPEPKSERLTVTQAELRTMSKEEFYRTQTRIGAGEIELVD